MPNHRDVIAVPVDGGGLYRSFRHVHRHYVGFIDARARRGIRPDRAARHHPLCDRGDRG